MIGGDIVSPVTVLYDNLGNPIPLSVDAFQRLRISSPETQFDSKQVYDSQPLYWTTLVTGGASTQYTNLRSSSALTVVGGTDRAVRQTKRYFSYQPGKSFLVMATYTFTSGGQANVTKRVGYFDDSNGIYLELVGSTLNIVIRSNVSGVVLENRVPRAGWFDKLDGEGPSGKLLNIDQSQIFFCDFEWLGVGSVRVGLVIDGQFVTAHKFYHANNSTSVYMQTPNLPIRYECLSSGGGGSLEAICSTVISEGGVHFVGTQRSIVRSSGVSVASGATQQLISIRNKSGNYLHAPVYPEGISISCSSTGSGVWRLLINPTVTGSFTAVVLGNSAVEYDQTRTTVSALGVEMASGTFSGSSSETTDTLSEKLALGVALDNTRDELVLAVTNTNPANETYWGSISWKEPN